MGKRKDKYTRAAHIKQHTVGTSNEISFSVLDKKSATQADEKTSAARTPHLPNLGAISLFTLKGKKKLASTPEKEKGLFLSSGEFVAVGDKKSEISSTPQPVKGISGDGSSVAADSGINKTGAGVSSGVSAPSVSQLPAIKKLSEPSAPKSPIKEPSWQPPADLVKERKTKRKRAKRIAITLTSCAVVAAIIGVAVLVYKNIENHQAKMNTLGDAVTAVDNTRASISEFNEFVELVMVTPLADINSTDVEAQLENMSEDLTLAEEQFNKQKSAIEGMQKTLDDTRSTEVSNQALIFLNAELNSLGAGRDVVTETANAAYAYQKAQEGWDQLLAADSLTREAAALSSSTSLETANKAIEKTNQAIEEFKTAKATLTEAQNSYDVDLSVYLEYIDARIAAQTQAIQVDQAFINRNKEEMTAANDTYNQLENAAVEIIKTQSDTPYSIIGNHFEAQDKELSGTYETQKSIATNAYLILQDYLGTLSK